MPRFRLSRLAQADLAYILATSAKRWGIDGRRCYAAVLAAGMRKVAADPKGATTRTRAELAPGLRSFHMRFMRIDDANAKVKRPAHILYYRVVAPDVIEIVRVLHERMEPSQHLPAVAGKKD